MTEPTKSVEVTLLPCPFCGSADLGDPATEQVEYNSWSGSITCDSCDTEVGTSYTEPSVAEAIAQIIKQWNTRTPPGESGEVTRPQIVDHLNKLKAEASELGQTDAVFWIVQIKRDIEKLVPVLSSPTDRTT